MIKNNKNKVSLIVSDIDGTVSPFWDISVACADNLLDDATQLWEKLNHKEAVGKTKGDIRQIFDKEILDRGKTDPGMREYYIHNAPRLLKSLNCLKPKNKADQKIYNKYIAKLEHSWDRQRAEKNKKLLPGVLQTVSKLKKSGGKFVLYSDAPMTSVISRVMLMPQEFRKHIDMVVSQPDANAFQAMEGGVEKHGPLVKLKSSQISKTQKELLDKFVVLKMNSSKPNSTVFKNICKALGVKEKRAVMVGDMPNDTLCVEGTEAKSAYQKAGASAKPHTIKTHNEKIPQPIGKDGEQHPYYIGTQVAEEKFRKTGVKPDMVLENGFADFSKYCEFVKSKGKADFSKIYDSNQVLWAPVKKNGSKNDKMPIEWLLKKNKSRA